jgi:hypothetical protein
MSGKMHRKPRQGPTPHASINGRFAVSAIAESRQAQADSERFPYVVLGGSANPDKPYSIEEGELLFTCESFNTGSARESESGRDLLPVTATLYATNLTNQRAESVRRANVNAGEDAIKRARINALTDSITFVGVASKTAEFVSGFGDNATPGPVVQTTGVATIENTSDEEIKVGDPIYWTLPPDPKAGGKRIRPLTKAARHMQNTLSAFDDDHYTKLMAVLGGNGNDQKKKTDVKRLTIEYMSKIQQRYVGRALSSCGPKGRFDLKLG